MSDLLRALVEELATDTVALDRLRQLVSVDVDGDDIKAPAYTVASLARELGRTERSIRGAIARGELEAVKRGRGYVISAGAVAVWAIAPPVRRSAVPKSGRRSAPGPRTGPMRRALG